MGADGEPAPRPPVLCLIAMLGRRAGSAAPSGRGTGPHVLCIPGLACTLCGPPPSFSYLDFVAGARILPGHVGLCLESSEQEQAGSVPER